MPNLHFSPSIFLSTGNSKAINASDPNWNANKCLIDYISIW